MEKTYKYNNKHNPRLPADFWFQNPSEGLTLFIVFYTKACRWNKCLGCNLPSLMCEYEISYRDIIRQVDYIFDYILDDNKKRDLRKIIISNNGSVLDEETFSTTALLYFIAKMNIHCPYIKVLSMESRPEYVDYAELEVMSRAIKEGETPTELEISIGFEAFDEKIRNDHFNKGLDLRVFEKFVSLISEYGYLLKTYFMLKPVPGITNEEAVNDIKSGIEYLDGISKKYNLRINMHLNPTYVARETQLEEFFKRGEYEPPYLSDLVEIIKFNQGKNISLYIGLSDEGLAVEGGSFIRKGDEEILEKLHCFNQYQDYNLFK